MVNYTQRIIEQISELTADLHDNYTLLEDTTHLLETIVKSGFPAEEMFDFFLKYNIHNEFIMDMFKNHFKEDLIRFCAAMILVIPQAERFTFYGGDVWALLVDLSERLPQVSTKTTEQLANELLDVL